MEREYSHIDVNKSIAIRTLQFKDSGMNMFDTGLVSILFGLFAGFFIVSINRDLETNDQIDYVYLLLKTGAMIACAYIVYRKLTEKKLFSIRTNLSKEKARRLIDEYFERLNYRSWNSTEELASYTNNQTFIGVYNFFIIPLDNEVLFTVIKDQERLPLPAIITLWTTRTDLKKVLSAR